VRTASGRRLQRPAGLLDAPQDVAQIQGRPGPGHLAHTNADGTVKELAVGSYVFQPGKKDHDDECKSKTDCILFVHQHAKGDFIPAKAAAPAK
jgi:hypothetical protein